MFKLSLSRGHQVAKVEEQDVGFEWIDTTTTTKVWGWSQGEKHLEGSSNGHAYSKHTLHTHAESTWGQTELPIDPTT